MTASTNSEIVFTLRPAGDPVPPAERERLLADPGFGQIFTDHMVTIRWSADRGWHDAEVTAYGPLTLDPATQVFHYAQEIFEGLKAYRQASGPDRGLPAAGQRGPVQPLGGQDGDAGAARVRVRSRDRAAGHPGP